MRDSEIQIDSYSSSIERINYDLSKVCYNNDWFFLWGDVDSLMTENCSLFLMDKLFSGREIATIFICSAGGSEDDARGLMSIIEHCKTQGLTIRMFGAGLVASAAFDIFIAGSKGWRFVNEFTMFMTHSSSVETRDKAAIRLQEYLDEYSLQYYTRIHKKTRERYLETGNWYFSADEGLGFGACDAVIKPGMKLPDKPVTKRTVDKIEEKVDDVGKSVP